MRILRVIIKWGLSGLLALSLSCGEKGKTTSFLETLNGPLEKSTVSSPEEAPVYREENARPTEPRIAVLLIHPDNTWLGVAHGFKSWGIPCSFYTDLPRALQHEILFIYPYISGNVLSPEELNSLRTYVEAGNTLIAANVLGGGLQTIFGFQRIDDSVVHQSLIFQETRYMEMFGEPLQQQISISSEDTEAVLGSHSFSGVSAEVLARYEDGSAAIIGNTYGRGNAFALGFDPGFLLLRAFNHRADGWYDSYVNRFAPGVDLLLRLFAGIFKQHHSFPLILARTPLHYPLAVVISHDVDYVESYPNSLVYARLEQEYDVQATYFIQTKYLADYQAAALLDEQTARIISDLAEMRMEIASHSVSHSYTFADFPAGTGNEIFPGYQPRIISPEETAGGTIFGELRVSKFLLDEILGEETVCSFRPGFLSYPFALPQVLEAAGYRYSSSTTANSSLTHLPFRLTYNREYSSRTGVYEFPIAIEDEEFPPMDERLEDALDVAAGIARYNGLFVVLIHPNELEHKYRFLDGLLRQTRTAYWYGTLREFGDWWVARDQIEVSAERLPGGMREVTLQGNRPFRDLALEIPPGYLPVKTQADRVSVQGNRLIIRGSHTRITVMLEGQEK